MKRMVCVFIILCACFFTSACAYRNDINTRYTLNAVVEKTDMTDAGVTVEISPISAIRTYDMDFPEEDVVRGYAVYRGNGHTYGNIFCQKSANRLIYELKREDDLDALKDLMVVEEGSRIIKFTVSGDRILMFEDTYCDFLDHDEYEIYEDYYDD